MKKEKILTLTPAQLDIAVGEKIMGWHRKSQRRSKDCGYIWLGGDNYFQGCQCEFQPSKNIAQAFEVEQKMADKGLQDRYAYQLSSLALSGGPLTMEKADFSLAHASPEVRCRAALLALEGK